MAALSFQEKFKNKLSTMGKQGEFSMSQSRPVAAVVPESKSHFHYAAASVIGRSPSPQAATEILEQIATPEKRPAVPVFAKPISITRKVISDTFSECAQPIRVAGTDVTISETATVDNQKVSRSIDFNHRSDESQPSVLYPLLSAKAPSNHFVREHRKNVKSADFTPYTLQDYRKIKPTKYFVLGGLGPINKESQEWKLRFQLHRRRVEYGQRVLRSAKEGTPVASPSLPRYSPGGEENE